MRTDIARLAVTVALCTLAVGCQSNWDWWRSSKRTSPSSSALAGSPPPYQPTLPSAQPGSAAAGPYNGVAAYPNTGYPAGPAAVGTALTTTTPPAGGYPVAGRPAPAAWPPVAGAGTVAATPYPSPTAGLAQTQPAGVQPASIYPTTTTPPAAAAAQVGQYSGTYSAPADALAKSGAAATAPPADRYASVPSATRYDVTQASPPDRAPVSQDRYGLDSQRYSAAGSTPPSYAASAPGPTAPVAAPAPATGTGNLAEINKATPDRYGSGTGPETKAADDRYKTPSDNLYQPNGVYQQSGLGQPASSSPYGAPASTAPKTPAGEYQPGSIKRYAPPTGTSTPDPYQSRYSPPGTAAVGNTPPPAAGEDIQNFHFFVSATR